MKTIMLLSAVLTASLLIVGVSIALPPENRTQLANASHLAVFDHSQCQYPERSTNPENGCDNSDPCDPMDAVKGGSGGCKQLVQTTIPKTPTTSTPENTNKSNQCGGK